MERRRVPFRTKSQSRICYEHDVRRLEYMLSRVEVVWLPLSEGKRMTVECSWL